VYGKALSRPGYLTALWAHMYDCVRHTSRYGGRETFDGIARQAQLDYVFGMVPGTTGSTRAPVGGVRREQRGWHKRAAVYAA